MTTLDACMSSVRMDWGTPQYLFDRYNAIYKFDLDAAATHLNRKVLRFIGPPGLAAAGPYCVGLDALSMEEWPGEKIWLNSPYGRELAKWYAKAKEQAVERRKTVVMLAPSRTDTSYWHEFVWDAENQRPHPW